MTPLQTVLVVFVCFGLGLVSSLYSGPRGKAIGIAAAIGAIAAVIIAWATGGQNSWLG